MLIAEKTDFTFSGLIIGLCVGTAVLVVILIVLGVYFWVHRRRTNSAKQASLKT